MKNEYFFLVDWFPPAPISEDWFGKDGVLPAEMVFLSQEDAEVAGEPKGDMQDEEPWSVWIVKTFLVKYIEYL